MVIRTLACLTIGAGLAVGTAWFGAFRDTDDGPLSFIQCDEEGCGPPAADSSGLSVVPGWVRVRRSVLTTRVSANGPISMIICGNAAAWVDDTVGPTPEPPKPKSWDAVTPSWARHEVAPVMASQPSRMLGGSTTVHGHGWPARCLCTVISYDSSQRPTQTIRGGLAIPHSANAQLVQWRGYGIHLPYQPIWVGLALNSLVLGAPLWCLFALAPPLRRHLRLRRHHCPACNYNLAGLAPDSPCPECGSPAATLRAPNH